MRAYRRCVCNTVTSQTETRFNSGLVSPADHTCFQGVKKDIKILWANYLGVDNAFLFHEFFSRFAPEEFSTTWNRSPNRGDGFEVQKFCEVEGLPACVVRSYPKRRRNVRFTPESGHVQCNSECPLCANSGHFAISFDHLVGRTRARTAARRGAAATASQWVDSARSHRAAYPTPCACPDARIR